MSSKPALQNRRFYLSYGGEIRQELLAWDGNIYEIFDPTWLDFDYKKIFYCILLALFFYASGLMALSQVVLAMLIFGHFYHKWLTL